MYTKFLLLLCFLICTPCKAADTFEIFITNNIQLEGYLKFFDKLNNCTAYNFNAEHAGPYKIFGKNNGACHVKWTFADCYFPNGIYQKVAEIQQHRAIERNENIKKGILIENKDREYRELYQIGNQYCKILIE